MMNRLFEAALFFTVAVMGCGGGASDDTAETGQADAGPNTGADADVVDGSETSDAAIAGTAGWVRVDAGSFTIGSPTSEACRREHTEPQRDVTLTHSFEIEPTEVTVADYVKRTGEAAPATFAGCGDDCPMREVSWHEAAAYCTALSTAEALNACYSCSGSGANTRCTPLFTGAAVYGCEGYRLPSEAEWETAYRAGSDTATYAGDVSLASCESCSSEDDNLTPIAWTCQNSAVSYEGCRDLSGLGGPSCAGPQPVGQKQANAWGLYDMAGNVDEWCHDAFLDSTSADPVTDPMVEPAEAYFSRVVRGGSWTVPAGWARASQRGGAAPEQRLPSRGFRCVRSL